MNCVNCIAIIFMNIINTPVAHFNIFDLWTQLICIIINYYYKQNNFVYANVTKQKRKNHSNAYKTRIAERRFLTGLQRGYFFWGEGAAIHTQATIKPCRQPLHATESHVRLKHKLIQNIAPFWKTFVTKKRSTIFKWGLYNYF